MNDHVVVPLGGGKLVIDKSMCIVLVFDHPTERYTVTHVAQLIAALEAARNLVPVLAEMAER